ncbi:hypothetical protein [Burkholderia anthina]|uniref:Uncharacterized protein n=2 Tax=Burkholderia anthina TaxID=179879 RepID=A0ABS2BBP6_9BURK|nr:hypothetical protein [Burkholderia anthina]MBM2769933.1 hypothetical protein [Burkholderia anthina]
MTAGLQIFDGSGRPMLDARTRAGRIVGIQWIANDGSIAADLSSGEPFWAFAPEWIFKRVGGEEPKPLISIDSRGISWRYSANASGSTRYNHVPGWLIYGVF